MKKAHDFPVMSYLMVCKDGVVGESLGIACRAVKCCHFVSKTIKMFDILHNFHNNYAHSLPPEFSLIINYIYIVLF